MFLVAAGFLVLVEHYLLFVLLDLHAGSDLVSVVVLDASVKFLFDFFVEDLLGSGKVHLLPLLELLN